MDIVDYYVEDFILSSSATDPYNAKGTYLEVSFSGHNYRYAVMDVNGVFESFGSISSCYYYLRCVNYDGQLLTEVLPSYSYYVEKTSLTWDFHRTMVNFPPDSVIDDIDYSADNQLVWFYSVGKSLISFSTTAVNNILGFSIGGTNLFSILLSGGILMYLSWVVVKFIIPF